jgi:hypothetical protein
MSSTKLAAVAVATAMLAVQGCGGSSKSSSGTSAGNQAATSAQTGTAQSASTTPPLTRVALIAKADPICARIQAQRASKVIKTRQDYTRAASVLASIEKRANDELAKLTPPTSLASTWSQMLVGYRTITSDLEQISDAIALKRTPVNIIRNAEMVKEHIATLARSAGFHDCARS